MKSILRSLEHMGINFIIGSLKFSSIDIHNQYYFELSGFFGVRNSDKIEVAILNPSDKFKKYVLSGKPTLENLSTFITDFIYGRLTPRTVTKTPVPQLPVNFILDV